MFKQILVALEASESDIVYFCEADVLYHPSHFDFTPSKKDVFYYNENVWKLDAKTGHALHYECRQVSGIAKTYSYNPETELNRLTYKFRDESKKEKRQEKFKPLREKPPEDE